LKFKKCYYSCLIYLNFLHQEGEIFGDMRYFLNSKILQTKGRDMTDVHQVMNFELMFSLNSLTTYRKGGI